MTELLPRHERIDTLEEYLSEYATARARNARLEYVAGSGKAPPESMVVFSDFIQTFPDVPLKTRTDIGYDYEDFTYADIIHRFFRKIGVDVQTTGKLPSISPEIHEKINEYMTLGRTENPLADDYENMMDLGIEPHVIPNIATAARLSGFASQHGYHLNNLYLRPVGRTRNFRREFEVAQLKNDQVLALAQGQNPHAVRCFADCIQSFPFVPLKLTTNTRDTYEHTFGRMVDEFFIKMSHMVASGFPVKQAASAQLEVAQEYLSKVGLSLDLIAHINDISIPQGEEFNGRMVACTLPNLIVAEKLKAMAKK